LVLQFSNSIVSCLCRLVGCFLLLLHGRDLLAGVCVCSEAWRILFILWGKKIENNIVSYKGIIYICVYDCFSYSFSTLWFNTQRGCRTSKKGIPSLHLLIEYIEVISERTCKKCYTVHIYIYIYIYIYNLFIDLLCLLTFLILLT
jgi:hypothetical protein